MRAETETYLLVPQQNVTDLSVLVNKSLMAYAPVFNGAAAPRPRRPWLLFSRWQSSEVCLDGRRP